MCIQINNLAHVERAAPRALDTSCLQASSEIPSTSAE
jgi:hypothetical protein